MEAVLGQGGFGAVFRAVHHASGRPVALKWLLPSAAADEAAIERFLAEARTLARIDHPNVVGILDVGEDRGAPFLVMELLHGETLGQRLAREGRLPPVEAVDVLVPVLRGVAEAHAEGVIHRDLKPDNIFLCQSKDGRPRPPKVVDFGISKLAEGAGDSGPVTKTGIAIGTPHYMAPEQLNAPKVADPRFDVYAMGVVLYETLTGRRPYDAEGLLELLSRIAAGRAVPPSQVVPDVPPELDAVVLRAMHADIDTRHRSMEELARALEALRPRLLGPGSSSPVTAPVVAPTTPLHVAAPFGAAATPVPPARRSRAGLLIGAGLSLVVVAGAILAALALFFDEPAHPEATAARPAREAPAASSPPATPMPSTEPASPTTPPERPAPAAAPTYAQVASEPDAHRGASIQLEGVVAAGAVRDGGFFLFATGGGCDGAQPCAVWATGSSLVPREGSAVRVRGRVEGQHSYTTRASTERRAVHVLVEHLEPVAFPAAYTAPDASELPSESPAAARGEPPRRAPSRATRPSAAQPPPLPVVRPLVAAPPPPPRPATPLRRRPVVSTDEI